MSHYRTDPARDPALAARRRSERGAIVPILAMVITLVALGTSAVLTTMSNMKRVNLNQRSVRALQVAHTGVARALYELELQQDLDKATGIGNVRGTFNGGFYLAIATKLSRGYYRVESRGTVNGAHRSLEVFTSGPRTAYALGALVSKASITMIGTYAMDSYDSRDGSYASQAVNTDGWGTFAKENATVSSNLAIDAGPSAVIRGDARPGPNDLFTYHKDTRVSGTIKNLDEEMELPDPPIEDFVDAYNNTRNGTWAASGGAPKYDPVGMSLEVGASTKLTLKPGTYFFTSMKLVGGGQIEVSGETKIYVTGDIDISGGNLLNSTGKPENVEIIAHPYSSVGPSTVLKKAPLLSFTGGPASAFAFYGPAYTVVGGGTGSFFGSIVGNDITVSGIEMHYDEALAEADNLTTTSTRIRKYMRVFTRELGRPAF